MFLFLLRSLFLGCHEVVFLRELFPLQGVSVRGALPICRASPTCGMGTPINTRYCGSVTAMSTQIFAARAEIEFVSGMAGAEYTDASR